MRNGEGFGRLVLLLIVASAAGCGPSRRETLTVATNWPAAKREALGRELASASTPLDIRWIRVGSDEDPTRSFERRTAPIDIVLGGPVASHARLAAKGRTTPFAPGDVRPWRALDRSTSQPPGTRRREDELAQSPQTVEGVSLMAGSPHGEAARAFLQALGETNPTRPAASLRSVLDDAAITDPEPELRAAEKALRDRNFPPKQRGWMNAPPPWPPASITRMRTRRDGPALIATLAGQVAPDPAKKAILLEMFDRVPKPIDEALLLELDETGLAADPRFRAWIRSEWSAWARQRYRRVLRNLTERERPPG